MRHGLRTGTRRQIGRVRFVRSAALALGVVACGGEGPGDPGDLAPAEAGGTDAQEQWRLADTPEFSVSESSGAPTFQVHQASHGVITEDGHIVVGNGGSGELIHLDATGQPVRVTGGRGSGPGEFNTIDGMFVASGGDLVWVSDLRERRVSAFSLSGEYRESRPLFGEELRGVLPDGHVVTIAGGLERRAGQSVGEPRRYTLRGPGDDVGGELHGLPELPVWAMVFERPTPTGIVEGTSTISPACMPRLDEVVVGAEIFTLDAADGVVRAISGDGSTREVYRTRVREPITPEFQAELRSRYQGTPFPPSDQEVDRTLLAMGDLGDPLPAWVGMKGDPSGRLWLERADCLYPGGARSFDVIDTDGQSLATIDIPPDLSVRAVRGDRVLAIRRDPLGVEHIEVYRILR